MSKLLQPQARLVIGKNNLTQDKAINRSCRRNDAVAKPRTNRRYDIDSGKYFFPDYLIGINRNEAVLFN